jgi:hypothetical protein
MVKLMVTTTDNPFNPFDQFDEWYAYDVGNGYCTSAYLARVVKSSDELSEEQQTQAINDAVVEIASENLTGNYKIVESE